MRAIVGDMVSSWPAGRAGLVARSRFYLAVVATGGMAVGGALTIAVADVPTATQAQPQTRPQRTPAHRIAHRSVPRQGATSATSPVRAVHHPASHPTVTTHAS